MKLRDVLKESLNKEIDDWRYETKKKYGLTHFVISERGNDLDLELLVVPKNQFGQGIGTKVMKELCNIADKYHKRIILTPENKNPVLGTTSRNRLIKFYQKFGFVLNKNKNKDFTIVDLMYRNPQ